MLSQRSPHQRSASYERSGSEGLVDLNVFVVPSDVWRNNQTSSVNQIVTDSISAGYIRVHPESFLGDLRKEIDRQLGFDALPRDYIFLRCLGRCFTQIKPKQESELKVKYFTPPRTYSPELYIVDGSAAVAGRFSTSSNSSRPSVHLQPDSHSRLPPFLPPAYGVATSLSTHQQGGGSYRPNSGDGSHLRKDPLEFNHFIDLSYRDHAKPDDILRRKREDNLRKRDEDEAEEEDQKRRRLREEAEEKERTKRLIDELERSRQEELEDRQRMEEQEDLRRMRRLEEEEEEDRIRLRRLIEEDGRRQQSQDHEEEISRPRTPSPTPRQRTYEKNDHRDVWKKRFFEEKKRTGPREDNAKILKEELDSINRKIIDQMENIRDNARKSGPVQSTIDKAHKMKLEATKMENEIDDLQSKLQDTKLQLTTEMKLRNQSERELQFLKAELAQLKVKSLPRLDNQPHPRTVRYSNGTDGEEEEADYDEPAKKTTVQLTYREPYKAPRDLPSVRLVEPQKQSSTLYQAGSLEEAFRAFATKNNGKEATGADIFKWSVDAGIIGTNLNNHHVDISFCKIKPQGMKTITMKEMIPLIDELAVKYRDDTKLTFQSARKKLIEKFTRAPFKLHGATQVKRGRAMDRLTNVKKNTGLSKDQYDPRTGRRIGGPVIENNGYVANYKLAGTYDKTQ